jgi:hypothetical protein
MWGRTMPQPLKIAVCDDIKQFHGDRLKDRTWSARFPGAAWVTSLHERQTQVGVEVASGDVALARVRSGEWRAADVHVVQELDAWHGRALCSLGAHPAVLTMLESPLVAYRQVDRMRRRMAPFAYCIGPEWAFSRMRALAGSRIFSLRFPCAWRAELSDSIAMPVSIEGRSGAVLVAANKRFRPTFRSQCRDLKCALRAIRHGVRRSLSPTFRALYQVQLHDERLALIAALGSRGLLDVWGHGWDRLDAMPRRLQRLLYPMKGRLMGPCIHKGTVLRRYRFAIAFENTALPGYITEKLIDAIIAGCVPIYRGAPDADLAVPAGAFVDSSTTGGSEQTADLLACMDDGQAARIVSTGRAFLTSPAADIHTFEGFADWIVQLVRKQGS